MSYEPQPIATANVKFPAELEALVEDLARHNHDIWAAQRMEDGWRYGPQRDDHRREHPCLVPYEDLSEEEKRYDRNAARETIKAVLALGYVLQPPPTAQR